MPDKDSMLQKYENAQQHNFKTDGLQIEEQIKLPGHSWNISAVQFNSNGLFLASASWDKKILVWDLKTLEDPNILENGHCDPITCISWFPQIDSMMVSGSSDRSLIIWNVNNKEAMAK
jgi:FOG: WD40 repeat